MSEDFSIADTPPDRPVAGRVKWFNSKRQYGFIHSDEIGSDILIHSNVLQAHGRSSIEDGAEVVVHVETTDRGLQVVRLLSISAPPRPASSQTDRQVLTEEELQAIPLQPARVRWFNITSGYGFANVFGSTEDIFIHADLLTESGCGGVEPGEALALRMINGQRGPIAVQIVTWFSAPSLLHN